MTKQWCTGTSLTLWVGVIVGAPRSAVFQVAKGFFGGLGAVCGGRLPKQWIFGLGPGCRGFLEVIRDGQLVQAAAFWSDKFVLSSEGGITEYTP